MKEKARCLLNLIFLIYDRRVSFYLHDKKMQLRIVHNIQKYCNDRLLCFFFQNKQSCPGVVFFFAASGMLRFFKLILEVKRHESRKYTGKI